MLEPQGLERVEAPQQGQELPVEPPGRGEQLAVELLGRGEPLGRVWEPTQRGRSSRRPGRGRVPQLEELELSAGPGFRLTFRLGFQGAFRQAFRLELWGVFRG
jgi:hypothetical protein